MNDHEHARRSAAEAIDFALAPDDRAALDAHLLACAACRSFAERLADDGLAMAMLPPIEPPADLRSSLLTGVASGGPDARPRERVPLFRSRTILTLTAATVVVAVVAGTLIWWTGRPPEGGVANVSPAASPARPTDASASTEPSPGGAPTTQPGDTPPAAALTASVDRQGVVPLDAGFTLVSLDGTPAAELASRLTVEPPLELAIEPSQDGRSARLTPSEPLAAGTVYRFTLVNATGEPVDGWAFQADQPLRVVGTLPGDQQTDVPLRTGIEITFDQDGVTDAASHVTIEPAVKGRFEEHGRVLAFVPEGWRRRPSTPSPCVAA